MGNPAVDVVGVLDRLVVGLVAGEAVGGRPRVLPTHVATSAVHLLVGSGEREPGLAVIERGRSPAVHAVAARARRGEGGRHVVRVLGGLIVRLVAGEAVGGRARVLAAHVAAGTGHRLVPAGEGEPGLAVIEGGRSPGVRGVAGEAGGREAGRDVVRVLGGLVLGLVARDAVGGRARVLASHVTLGAVHALVGAREGESGLAVVGEGRGPPGVDVVAGVALGGESGRDVVGVLDRLVVGLVAGEAVGGRPRVLPTHVATSAVHLLVGSGEREPGLAVIERGRSPTVHAVAGRARRREGGRHVVRVLGGLVLGLVAGDAVGGRARVLAPHVALGAVHALVSTREGESGLAVVGEGRGPPGVDVVAGVALGGESGRDVVGVLDRLVVGLVAGEAVGGRPRVLAAHVATSAVHLLVRPGQGEPGPAVIEGGGTPGAGGVAGHAGRGESGRDVVRSLRGLVRGLVAGEAVRGRARVLAAHVALGAIHALVGAREGESGLAMVGEGRGPPGVDVVAGVALGGESGRDVVGVLDRLVVGLVAGDAVGGRARVLAAHVATSAVDLLVRPRQGEPGPAVIEGGGPPGSRGVAGHAGGREAGRRRGSGSWWPGSWPGGTRRSRWRCPCTCRPRGSACSPPSGARP